MVSYKALNTIFVSSVSDRGNAFRQLYGFQSRTLAESHSANLGDRLGADEALQFGTSEERANANLCQRCIFVYHEAFQLFQLNGI